MSITTFRKKYSLGILIGCSGWLITGSYLAEEYAEAGSSSNLIVHLTTESPFHHFIMILLIPLMMILGYLFIKNYGLREKLSFMSFTDELTGLYNRRGFFALADQQLKLSNREKKGMFLISSDIDNLKKINDTLGHIEGDAALLETAIILKKSFRESDIISRLGGDEFVILATENPETTIETLTVRLKANLNDHNTSANKPYMLSLSIGVAHYDPVHPISIEELLFKADKLMYEEKEQKS
jgi:diguanylate cyclase (GGDEF)-like protein